MLIAGENGGKLAKMVFAGFWTALLYSLANKLFALWREVPRLIATGPTAASTNATLTSEVTPEYLGVGYIIGPRIAGSLVSGGVLSWLALIPLISIFVPDDDDHRRPDEARLHGGLDRRQLPRELDLPRLHPLHRRRRRGLAGVMTLIKTLPDDRLGVPRVVHELRGGAAAAAGIRTERDIPITWVGDRLARDRR